MNESCHTYESLHTHTSGAHTHKPARTHLRKNKHAHAHTHAFAHADTHTLTHARTRTRTRTRARARARARAHAHEHYLFESNFVAHAAIFGSARIVGCIHGVGVVFSSIFSVQDYKFIVVGCLWGGYD